MFWSSGRFAHIVSVSQVMQQDYILPWVAFERDSLFGWFCVSHNVTVYSSGTLQMTDLQTALWFQKYQWVMIPNTNATNDPK